MAQKTQTQSDKTVVLKTAKTSYNVPERFASCTNISQVIRAMAAEGMSKGDISRAVTKVGGGTIRYQHVRNVLLQPVADKK